MIRLSPNADSTYWSAPSLDPDSIDLPPPLVYHSVKHSIPLLSSIFNQIEDAATNPYARATGAGAIAGHEEAQDARAEEEERENGHAIGNDNNKNNQGTTTPTSTRPSPC